MADSSLIPSFKLALAVKYGNIRAKKNNLKKNKALAQKLAKFSLPLNLLNKDLNSDFTVVGSSAMVNLSYQCRRMHFWLCLYLFTG